MTEVKIKVEFLIKEIVYISTDKEQEPAIVTSFIVDVGNAVLYRVRRGAYESTHYGFELSKEKDFLLSNS